LRNLSERGDADKLAERHKPRDIDRSNADLAHAIRPSGAAFVFVRYWRHETD